MRLPDNVYRIYAFLKGRLPLKVAKYPKDVDTGITNFCNLNCKMCPHNKISKKQEFMDPEFFKRIVNTIRDKCESKPALGLALWGEALLHPNFKDFLQYATQEGIKTKMSSNCVNLTPDISQAIIESSMNLFEISFYTFDREEYNKMVGKEVFDVVLKNIHIFLTMASENKFKGYIRLRPLASYSAEIDKYKKEFYEKYPLLNFQRQTPKELVNWAGSIEDTQKKQWWKKIYARKPCLFCFSRLTIDWDGEVHMCCQSMVAPDLSIGHITEEFDLYDMWNSDKLNNIRKKLLNLDYSSFPSCQKCHNSRRYLN